MPALRPVGPPILDSLTGRMVLAAAVAVAVFALCFGLFSRGWVTRILRADLELRAAALGQGMMVAVAEAAALGDRVGLHAMLRETAAAHPEVSYIAVLSPSGELIAQSSDRPLTAEFVKIIAQERPQRASLALRTELGLVRDVAVMTVPGRLAVVHVGIGEQALTELLESMTRLLSLAALMALVAGLLSAWLAGRRMNGPLANLAQASRQIAEFARRQDSLAEVMPSTVPVLGKPSGIAEIDLLCQSFQQLSESLAANRARLWQTQQAMVQAERMAALGAFVAGTAHAVNNPLSGVRACLEMIEAAPADVGRLKRYLGLAHEGLARIHQLMARLVRFVPKVAEDVRPCDLHRVLQHGAVDGGTMLCDNHKFAVNFALTATQHWIIADPDEVEQTLTNLLINAAQVTPAGQPIRVHTCDDGPGWVRVDVEDCGPGVPNELRDRVFEPFFTTKAEGKGTGLGLWVAWRFAERSGGRIAVADGADGGARFSLWLPATAAAADRSADPLGGIDG